MNSQIGTQWNPARQREMPMIEHEISYIFSSNPANGALNVTDNGSHFSVVLDTPIAIPADAKACTAEMQGASIWYVSPNISASIGNNEFYFIVGGVPEQFTIPDGLYSLSALNSYISQQCVSLGYNSDQIILSGNSATQKSVFTFPYINTQVNFTANDSPFDIVGFTQRLVPLAPSTAGQSEEGDSQASYNQLNSYLVHWSPIQGVPVNNQGANIIGKVPILLSPGSQINYNARNPLKTECSELTGQRLTAFDIWVTDQDNNKIDTFGEFFDVTIVLKFHI